MPVDAALKLAGMVLLFATLGVAAVTDILHRKVYNWLTYPAVIVGLGLGFAAGGLGSVTLQPAATGGLLDHLAGFACGFGVFAVAYFGKGVGAGDVKLMGAIGAIGGLAFTIHAMFWSGLVGAILALWVVALRGKLGAKLRSSVRYALTLRATPPDEDGPALTVPYGVAISFGTFLAWFLVELPAA